MAKFVLEFDTDNAAFHGSNWGPAPEIVRILRETADRIERAGIDSNDPRPIRDANGTTVGLFNHRLT